MTTHPQADRPSLLPCLFCKSQGPHERILAPDGHYLGHPIAKKRVRCKTCGAEADEELWNRPSAAPAPEVVTIPKVDLIKAADLLGTDRFSDKMKAQSMLADMCLRRGSYAALPSPSPAPSGEAVELARLRSALQELRAMVKGECPSLLNEDSGGNGNLAIEIDDLLSHEGTTEHTSGSKNEEPVNFIAATNILDRAHQALRSIDAADHSLPIPEKNLDAVTDAVSAIEEFCRDRRIVLSEFNRSPTAALLAAPQATVPQTNTDFLVKVTCGCPAEEFNYRGYTVLIHADPGVPINAFIYDTDSSHDLTATTMESAHKEACALVDAAIEKPTVPLAAQTVGTGEPMCPIHGTPYVDRENADCGLGWRGLRSACPQCEDGIGPSGAIVTLLLPQSVESKGRIDSTPTKPTPAAEPLVKDTLRSKPDYEDDPIEQLAFELAWELEEADLKPDDLVTVNKEKLRQIARRVYSRIQSSPAAVRGDAVPPKIYEICREFLATVRDSGIDPEMNYDEAFVDIAAFIVGLGKKNG